MPSAAGSAYLELEAPPLSAQNGLIPACSSLKLTCSVHGPRPVPRTASFSANLQLNTHVKFATFASRQRRGYIRDTVERDLSLHLETALRGALIPDRWPKSSFEVVVTILEGEEDYEEESKAEQRGGIEGAGLMTILAGCINVASVAIADARIDCLDLLAGGAAAIVPDSRGQGARVLDPCPSEHEELASICVVGYLPSRDELTEAWIKGDLTAHDLEDSCGVSGLVDSAVGAAKGSHLVLQEAVKESAERWLQRFSGGKKPSKPRMNNDEEVEMKT